MTYKDHVLKFTEETTKVLPFEHS